MSQIPNSLWWDSLTKPLELRPKVEQNIDVDIAIVGAGFTGLWTAYYLLKNQPSLKIAILEAQTVGYGASGRNGGWCSALFPVGLEKLAQQSNRETAIKMQNVMFETVEEVGKIIKNEGFEVEIGRAHV